MQEWLEDVEPVVSPQPTLSDSIHGVSNASSALSLRHLPPIKLPPFSGDFCEWEGFRDRFTALIISNKEISDFTRMHFLSTSVTGSAYNIIQSFPVTADNFAVAWTALVNRYENKRRLIEMHISELYNLPVISHVSASELHALRDRADKSISALRALGRSEAEVLSDIMAYFITSKLDPSTKRAWKLRCSAESVPLHYNELIKFISSRALALEELSPAQAKSKNVKAHNAIASGASGPNCFCCGGSHRIMRCPDFLGQNPTERQELTKQKGLCFNCLHPSHSVESCRSPFTCLKCRQQHHSLLHMDTASRSSSDAPAQSRKSANVNSVIASDGSSDLSESGPSAHAIAMSSVAASARPAQVLLATARVIIESPSGRRQAVRALLDQGSEVTFITEGLAQNLRLPRSRTFTQISAVGGSSVGTCRHASRIKIFPRGNSRTWFSANAFILPSLTKYCPPATQVNQNWSHLNDLWLADDEIFGTERIDLLIGADVYSSIILSGVIKGSPGQPIAQNSHFGWLVSGPVVLSGETPSSISALHCSLERELHRFWEVEELPTRMFLTVEEQKCEDHFALSHSRTASGRYVVRLPFKQGPPIDIGDSRATALRCLTGLTRRLSINDNLKSEYYQFLREYEQLDHMTPVPRPSPSHNQIVYIPHHAVIKESSSTTRLRVVFNASGATTNGTSLNSHSLPGPKLQTDLIEVLMRWRQFPWVYTADIAKMYRQILVDIRDCDYQRIIWYNESREMQEFQLNTVTYGTASAPFLALRVLKQLILDDGNDFPLAATILRDNIYVDDVLFGSFDDSHLRIVRQEVCALLSHGGFELRKWASNSGDLVRDIPPENHGLAGDKPFSLDDSLTILGISWNPLSDSFHFRVSLSSTVPNTKRLVLSAIAKLFDPLGWVTPVTVTAKIFMQQLWLLKIDWDEVLPPPTFKHWQSTYLDLACLTQLQIPRWTRYTPDAISCELHGFSDASASAYAAVIYMRIGSLSEEVTVRLLVAKSKVAPLKTLSIPRLELAAAALLARLMDFTVKALSLPSVPLYCWTDSTVVLAWLNSHPSRWKPFVANRIADIQTRIGQATWRYISTHENPADCASRGCFGSELKSMPLWWSGPKWLS